MDHTDRPEELMESQESPEYLSTEREYVLRLLERERERRLNHLWNVCERTAGTLLYRRAWSAYQTELLRDWLPSPPM
jgi:hypothetical protein